MHPLPEITFDHRHVRNLAAVATEIRIIVFPPLSPGNRRENRNLVTINHRHLSCIGKLHPLPVSHQDNKLAECTVFIKDRIVAILILPGNFLDES
jgi:hypothetical protein